MVRLTPGEETEIDFFVEQTNTFMREVIRRIANTTAEQSNKLSAIKDDLNRSQLPEAERRERLGMFGEGLIRERVNILVEHLKKLRDLSNETLKKLELLTGKTKVAECLTVFVAHLDAMVVQINTIMTPLEAWRTAPGLLEKLETAIMAMFQELDSMRTKASE